MGISYTVIVVDDDQLPAGHDWIIIEHTGGVVFAVRESANGDAHAAAEAWAAGTWEFYLRHPWVLQVAGNRPVLGPNELAGYEDMTAASHFSRRVLKRPLVFEQLLARGQVARVASGA